jgi:hypothetical protein
MASDAWMKALQSEKSKTSDAGLEASGFRELVASDHEGICSTYIWRINYGRFWYATSKI